MGPEVPDWIRVWAEMPCMVVAALRTPAMAQAKAKFEVATKPAVHSTRTKPATVVMVERPVSLPRRPMAMPPMKAETPMMLDSRARPPGPWWKTWST